MMSRLVRPRGDRMIAGVCAGLGLYFGVDPVIVRLLFVVLALTTGLTAILYPIFWIIMPEVATPQPLPPGARFDPQTGEPLPYQASTANFAATDESVSPVTTTPPRNRILALVLVGVGALIFLSQIGRSLGIDLANFAVPLLLIGLGMYLLRDKKVKSTTDD